MKVTTIGLDIAKNVFQVHGVDKSGKVVVNKRLTRNKVLSFFSVIESCLVGVEACGGAHYWARELVKLGHTVKLMSPQFVKPYVKGNKNDANDAAAICEAVSRPCMRFVSMKTVEQQDIQAVHRIRSRLIAERTAKVNQTRGLLAEYGIVVAPRIGQIRHALPVILEDGENGLSSLGRELFHDLYEQLVELDRKIASYDKKLEQLFNSNPLCKKLAQVEGVGPISATAFLAAVGDGRAFKNGREVAAWLGLVPRQHSSGDKQRLQGISKRGDRYVRMLLIHGARSVVKVSDKKQDRRNNWINAIKARRNNNIASVALANKNARILWALLTKEEPYRCVV